MIDQTIGIALSDDHALFRQALKRALSVDGRIEVITEASTYAELLSKVSHLETKIVLLDLDMPDLGSTIRTIRQLQRSNPDVKILILTMNNDPWVKDELMKCGIHNYIHKGADIELLIASIYTAHSELTITGSHASFELKHSPARMVKNPSQRIFFSEREKSILKLIIQGKTNKEIAGEIFLSVRSVEEIRRNMKSRVDAQNTVTLINFVIKNRLLE